MANFDDAFLQTYMQGNAERAQAQQAARQFAWQNLWTQAKLAQDAQQEQARLAQQTAYQNALVANDQERTRQEGLQRQNTANEQYLQLVKAGFMPGDLTGAPNPSITAQPGQQGPGLAFGQPQAVPGVGPAAPLHSADSAEVAGHFLRVPSPAELLQQQAAVAAARQQSLDTLKANGQIDDNTHRLLSAMTGAQAIGLPMNEAVTSALAPKPATLREGDEPLGDQADALNALTLKRLQVLDPSVRELPPEARVTPRTTRNQFANIDKLIGATEGAKATKAQQEQTNAIRREALDLSGQRFDLAQSKFANTIYQPAVDSAERLNIMTDSYLKANKGDQQAMLSLLSNHIGMTMGLQKGSRITQAIYDEAARSRPWLQGVKAHFDDRGYLSGVVLSPEQMQQMLTNGRERFVQDNQKATNQANAAGLTNPAPKRQPNRATKLFYLHEAGGDAQKAQALLEADGWSPE